MLLATVAAPALAQQPPGGGGDRPDFAEMRRMFSERMKEQLAATDAEWQLIGPLIDKVQQLQRDTSTGGMGMMFGPGQRRGFPGGSEGPGGEGGPDGAGSPFGGDQPQSAVQQKRQDLQNSLDKKDAPVDEIKAKVAAVREAQLKANADLAKAQSDLRDLLTVRQEAALIATGLLD